MEQNLTTIPDYLIYHNENHSDREAVVFVHTDGSRSSVTFGQLYENASILAKSFLSLGVKVSEFIAISLQNCPEWLYATFGAIMAGARPISLSFTYSDGRDVIAMMKKLETCSAIILDQKSEKDTWHVFRKLISTTDAKGRIQSKLMPYLKFLICREKLNTDDGFLTIEDLMCWKNNDVTLPQVCTDDIAVLFQTSGSTGLPKACVHTHRSLIAAVKCFIGHWTSPECNVMFNDRPFTWSGGFPWTIISGGTRVTRFGYCGEPNDIVGFLFHVIGKEKCKILNILPPLLNSLLERQDEVPDDWQLDVIATNGQPVSTKFATCIGRLCRRFMCGYGTTEFKLGCGITVDDPDNFKEYSIGYPFKGVQMKIVGKNEMEVSRNQRGEIYVKCDGMFKEYYNDPEKTKVSFTEDGWFRTDDIGFMSEEGLFFCEGRKSEVIISGGLNVAPTILESIIKNCPGVSNVICVPVAHDVMYQVVCACVILKDGSDVEETQLRQYCENTHNDKPRLFTVLPTYYLFLKEFPEAYSGKVARKELTKLATERLLSV